MGNGVQLYIWQWHHDRLCWGVAIFLVIFSISKSNFIQSLIQIRIVFTIEFTVEIVLHGMYNTIRSSRRYLRCNSVSEIRKSALLQLNPSRNPLTHSHCVTDTIVPV